MSTFDPDGLRKRIAELEAHMGEPGFWDDQQGAAAMSAQHARLARRVERYDGLNRECDDAAELLELDPDLLDDVATMLEPLKAALDTLQLEALFSGEYDGGDAIVTVHSGTGGTDSQDWTEMLLRMYLRWADDKRFKTELMEASPGEEAGLKSATFTARGDNAYGLFKAERGVHRLVRLSPFDSDHRRHTSFALVEVLPEADEEEDVTINPEDIRLDVFRAGGAGGQNVQKNSTAVRITHLPTNLVVSVQNERSQLQNRDVAMRILHSRLVDLEMQRRADAREELKGEHVAAEFGRQVRNYVLHPYQMVKDNRSGYQTGNAQAVLEGEIDDLLKASLTSQVGETVSAKE